MWDYFLGTIVGWDHLTPQGIRFGIASFLALFISDRAPLANALDLRWRSSAQSADLAVTFGAHGTFAGVIVLADHLEPSRVKAV
jgi:hypothetical protein